MKNTIIWSLTILAFVFLFFSLRSQENEMLYALIALGCWGIGFLLNKFLPKPDDQEEKKKA